MTSLFQSYRDAVQASTPGPDAPGRGSGGASAAIVCGVVLAICGGIAMAWQSGNHSACSSALVQAIVQGQCSADDAIWTLGILGLVLGAVLVVAGAILRSRP